MGPNWAHFSSERRESRAARLARAVRRYERALRKAGLRDGRFNDLRHTFGTRAAAAGVPMRTLWMGHRDLKATLIYADLRAPEHEGEMVERAFSQHATSPEKTAIPQPSRMTGVVPYMHLCHNWHECEIGTIYRISLAP